MTNTPKLVVEWESPIRAFLSSIKPAILPVRAPRMAFVRTGIPVQSPSASIVGHCLSFWLLLTFAPRVISPPVQVVEPRVDEASTAIIYWNPGLPNLDDVSGAESGKRGKAGGGEFHNASQVLRISRGPSVSPIVSTPPRLAIRVTDISLANLIALPGTQNAPALQELPAKRAEPAELVLRRGVRIEASSRSKLEPPVVRVPVPAAQIDLLAREPKLPMPVPPPVASEPMRIASSAADAPRPGLIELPMPSSVETLGMVLSVAPGKTVGMPAKAFEGSFASSPQGQHGGFGGAGSGNGIADGTGTGSATGSAGTGPGAGSNGEGHGSQINARGGISVSIGPGGAGKQTGTRQVQVPGVVIQGGVVYLPSFGSGSKGTSQPEKLSPQGPRRSQSVVVVATSRSGGALPAYGRLKGGRVYTIYIDTTVGTAVLQFADPAAQQGFEAEIKPPEPVNTEIDSHVSLSRTVVACAIDHLGGLRDPRIVETVVPQMAPQILEAIKKWRFRPALRGEQAIDVEAILGFAINTR